MFEYMQSAEDNADEIAKLYQKSSGYLSAELNKIFERYKRKHHLTDAEAYRLLNSLHDKTSIEELKEALRAGDGVEKDILAELESPAYRARLERLEQLQNQIDAIMREVYKQEKTRTTSHYVDLANEAYYRSIFDIQQRTGLGFSFSTIDPAVIDKVINSKWSGANYSTRIWNNTQALAQDLKEELLVNLVTGRTDREVAEIIANKYAQGASNARRLVRTESCNLANQMEMQSYEECGIDKYRYVATLDLRTSPACRKLDGKVFTVSEQQPGKNCPPMHPWCRSTTICEIDDMDMAGMQRRARDPVTGKTNTVPANMTYEQWRDKSAKNYLKSDKDISTGVYRVDKTTKDDIIKTDEIVTLQSKIRKRHQSEMIRRGIQEKDPIFDDGKLKTAYTTRQVKKKEGFYDVVMHGAPEYVEFFGEKMNHEQLAYIIRNRKDYDGSPVRLIACSTGKKDENGNCFAQRLADALGVEVEAPNDLLNIHGDGHFSVGEFFADYHENSDIFKPRKR